MRMRVLIVVQDATLGAALKVVVSGYTTDVQVALVTSGQHVFHVTNERGRTIHVDTFEDVDMVVMSHPNLETMDWVERLAQVNKKTLLHVLTGGVAVPFSAITLDLFKEMWPQIAEKVMRKLEKKT